jgi:hypothetical protein
VWTRRSTYIHTSSCLRLRVECSFRVLPGLHNFMFCTLKLLLWLDCSICPCRPFPPPPFYWQHEMTEERGKAAVASTKLAWAWRECNAGLKALSLGHTRGSGCIKALSNTPSAHAHIAPLSFFSLARSRAHEHATRLDNNAARFRHVILKLA